MIFLCRTPIYTVKSTVIMSMLMVIARPYAFSMRDPLLKYSMTAAQRIHSMLFTKGMYICP